MTLARSRRVRTLLAIVIALPAAIAIGIPLALWITSMMQ